MERCECCGVNTITDGKICGECEQIINSDLLSAMEQGEMEAVQ